MTQKFVGDPRSAWPSFKHDHEVGGRPWDCQECLSPRVFTAGDKRICASCGFEQEPGLRCTGCRIALSRNNQSGYCRRCAPSSVSSEPPTAQE
ncbi:zinc-ribbon domain containing protein [Streptomyces griseus]|uniref:zinc-ribbon domain containing protein n=1 Tax=Streptomyces griseus TaxID=1911 RepID=UPI0033A85375